MTSGRMTDLERLHTQIGEHVAAGRPVPCTSDPVLWLSDDPRVQAVAAAACMSCDALDDCRAYVANNPESAGVWAGLTPDQRHQPKPRKEHKK